MHLETFVLGELQTNCYLLDNGEQAVIIDPADDGDFLNEELLRRNLQLQAVVLTHGHFDHCLGLFSLKMAWPELKIYLHPADNFLLNSAPANAKFWLGRQVDPVPSANAELKDGQVLELLGEKIKVIHTPGHTTGSVALLTDKQNDDEVWLFTGDTLFANGVGRTDFSYSNKNDLRRSLKKLHDLKQSGQYSVAMAGHGERFW